MMGGVNDLAVWLREQLEQDERTLRMLDEHLSGRERPYNPLDPTDPVRVLGELEAKRRIVGEHSPHRNGACPVCWRETTRSCLRQDYPCLTLRLLALPYAGRPGYRQEWAP